MEDDWLIALALGDAMESAGWRVVGMAASGEEAVPGVIAARPQIVLLDVRLGGRMSGVEAAVAMRRHWDGGVIFHTADNDRKTQDAIAAVAGSRLVAKPAAPDRVAGAARDLLSQRLAATAKSSLRADAPAPGGGSGTH